MKYTPKGVPEGINSSLEHPLKEFLFLVLGLVAVGGVFYFCLGVLSDRIVENMSYQKEKDWFAERGPWVGKANVSVEDHGSVQMELQNLLMSLWEPYKAKTQVDLDRIQILTASFPNAFAFLGGQIAITSKLLESVESENELSFILCHEMGHFYLRHPLKRAGRSLALFSLLALMGLNDSPGASSILTGINFAELQYSRSQETEADFFAIDCMNHFYGHAHKFEDFFVRIKVPGDPWIDGGKLNGDKLPSYLMTHPHSEERVRDIKDYANQNQISLFGEVSPLKWKRPSPF